MRKLSVLVLVTVTLVGCERVSRICEGLVAESNEVAQVDVDLAVKDALMRMGEGLPSSPLYGGIEVDTTIDRRLQRKLTEILCRNADTNDTGVGISVILRVEDGAVLAMADCGDEMRDVPLALCYAYEPGAVMMPLTAAIAIEKDIARMDTPISTKRDDERYYKLPGDGGHVWPKMLSMGDAVVRSSCIVMGKVGYDLGEEQVYDGFTSFGLGQTTRLGCVGENCGVLIRRRRWDRVLRSRIPNGQGVEVTLLQLARAYAVLACGGVYVEPYVVSCVRSGNRVVYRHVKPEARQVVSKDTSEEVLKVLAKVPTYEGSAPCAAVPGVSVAGKTGTVQRADPDACHYFSDRFCATFVGCFPAVEPHYIVCIMIETRRIDGESRHQGRGRPAAAFAEIVSYMTRNESAGRPK